MVLDWAAAEGWNPGLDDAAAFLVADPDGFFLAEDDGAPVAAISVVNHSKSFAFLGLYLCRASHRGKGIGYALWKDAIRHADARTIGLDGVPDQQDNYVKSGFVHAGATTRYSGVVSGRKTAEVRQAETSDIDALVSLEAAMSGWKKPAYLSAWFKDSEFRRTFVLETGGRIAGLVTVRKCRSGAKIGPLIADDREAATALLRHAGLAFGDTVIIDVPARSRGLEALCRDLGLAPSFHTARMYRGPVREPSSDWYAVATLELG